MTMKERLRSDLTAAIKSRDELRAATLRMVLTAVTTEEVAGKSARELSDDDVVTILGREAKKRREAADAYAGAGRAELAERERAELSVIETYLPAQLSAEELAGEVAAAIAQTGAEGPKGMGQVMKVVTPRLKGRVDGGRLSAEVRRQLRG